MTTDIGIFFFKKNTKYFYNLKFEIKISKGVACIPPTAFYNESHSELAKDYARFCFCKTDETLQEAAIRLKKLVNYYSKS